MNGKDLFNIWASPDPTLAAERWTRFAKPALFVRANEYSYITRTIQTPEIPMELVMRLTADTAFIVDLPGAEGVEAGLGLAKLGARPVPLYNGIHETKIGGLNEVVENAPIIGALASGADILAGLELAADAPPAFLLDYNRNREVLSTFSMYDNRWSIDIDDMPEAAYAKANGLRRIIVWTKGELQQDLRPIVDSYSDMGIETLMFSEGRLTKIQPTETATEPKEDPAVAAAAKELQENVRKFENGRFGLLLIAIMTIVNFLFMFFGNEAPILWTTPTVMWLTYLWVPEIVGDIIATALTASYIALYFLSQRRRNLMPIALGAIGAETFILFVYAIWYGGLAAFSGDSFLYGLIVFGLPFVFLVFLVKGAKAEAILRDVSEAEYFASLDTLDDSYLPPEERHLVVHRRRHFRGFRGFGGYGGSGRGGYGGGGYRGYGGGYGGGFGG